MEEIHTERLNMNLAKKINQNLSTAIECVVANKEFYVKDPNVDFTRTRKLTLDKTIKLILSMEGGSLKKELYDFWKIHKVEITSSAFVQQRSKISSLAFKAILDSFNQLSTDRLNYRGYRILAVDGTDINHFRDPHSESFVTSRIYPYGYNQTHLNAIYDICNRTYLDVFFQPRNKMDERAALIAMLKRNTFSGKNILTLDRGYESYNLLAHLIHADNLDFVLRVKQGHGAIKEISDLPMEELDQIISFEVSTTQTNEDKQAGRHFIQTGSKFGKQNSQNTVISKWDFTSPYRFEVRVVRFKISDDQYETLITLLDKDEFSLQELKKLYHMRWGIETSFRELKYVVGLTHLHAKKEELVQQEIYAAIIIYNYCTRISACADMKKKQHTKHAYKVNFTMAVHLCKTFYKTLQTDFNQLITDICKYTEPVRLGRKDKRNIKHKRFVGFVYRVAA